MQSDDTYLFNIHHSFMLCKFVAACGHMVVASGPAVPCRLYWDMWVVSYFNPQCCQEYPREQTSAAVLVCVCLRERRRVSSIMQVNLKMRFTCQRGRSFSSFCDEEGVPQKQRKQRQHIFVCFLT